MVLVSRNSFFRFPLQRSLHLITVCFTVFFFFYINFMVQLCLENVLLILISSIFV
ncbi:hypothetical protein AtEden1_Chr4g0314421 [Arabidopsis thaliana]